MIVYQVNREIALALSISPNTVKTHMQNIMDKLHLKNRIEAAVYAVGEGLVDYPANYCQGSAKKTPGRQ